METLNNIKNKIGVVQFNVAQHLLSSQERADLHKTRTAQEKLEEAINLVEALPFSVAFAEIVPLRKYSARTVMGKGKVEELREMLAENEIEAIFINYQLSPTHQRNLEVDLDVKVIDRTGLILEIFSDRANTKAGRLQVELAKSLYEQSRLVKIWTHLERQRGGTSKVGGPGETQIELDRRILRDDIGKIKAQLEEVERTRVQHSKKRQENGIKVVSLVGYTNAGKSTIFNAITNANTLSKDMLFATLDPLMRKMKLPNGQEIILSDTVGFISDLPHELVESFKSTLQEVLDSDLLLHVQDVSSSQYLQENEDVLTVLDSIGAKDIKTVNVLNKMDLIDEENPTNNVLDDGIEVSGLKKTGIDDLLATIEKELNVDYIEYDVTIAISNSKALTYFYKHGKNVEIKENDENNCTDYNITVQLKEENYNYYLKNLNN